MGHLDLTPILNDGGQVFEIGMISAIASWCEFLQSKNDCDAALEEMIDGLDAGAIVLSRVPRNGTGSARVVCCDRQANGYHGEGAVRSFAKSVLGRYFQKSKAGSVWFKGMQEAADPDLIEFHRKRRFDELVVIPLAVNKTTMDFIEIHFSQPLHFEQHALLNAVAETLARTWKNRAPGLITQHLSKLRNQNDFSDQVAPILSMENPARLSRAEYRVCVLLNRGLDFKATSSELSISSSTLRTHLKNIYAKTDTSNLTDLVYHLVTCLPSGQDGHKHLKSA